MVIVRGGERESTGSGAGCEAAAFASMFSSNAGAAVGLSGGAGPAAEPCDKIMPGNTSVPEPPHMPGPNGAASAASPIMSSKLWCRR